MFRSRWTIGLGMFLAATSMAHAQVVSGVVSCTQTHMS
jgi:hypothetical protein